jgi:diazepam-binding inhibitor (GABA receptor modulator, acyl-CoA-binding protein)
VTPTFPSGPSAREAGGVPWPAMTLLESFEDAQRRVKALSRRPSNDELLELYGLFKQATAGDVSGARPGLLDPKGRAKFDAWTKKKGLAKDPAMTAYVALVNRLTAG